MLLLRDWGGVFYYLFALKVFQDQTLTWEGSVHCVAGTHCCGLIFISRAKEQTNLMDLIEF